MMTKYFRLEQVFELGTSVAITLVKVMWWRSEVDKMSYAQQVIIYYIFFCLI
jgi:hypothetical protein